MSDSVKFNLFDYLGQSGTNEIREWTKNLQKPEIAKLNIKLDMLEHKGLDLLPNILTGSPTAGILKLRVKGNKQLRPMLCRGPFDKGKEFTLLIGAIEKNFKFVPSKADEIANDRKETIIKYPNRRCEHERVS